MEFYVYLLYRIYPKSVKKYRTIRIEIRLRPYIKQYCHWVDASLQNLPLHLLQSPH